MATTINNKEHWWAATKGLLARNNHVDGKELQEDFLKYIYEHGKEMPHQQVDEAAKDLGTNREGMANIVGALVLAGELAANDTLALTEKGCMHALRLIRAHRIYPRLRWPLPTKAHAANPSRRSRGGALRMWKTTTSSCLRS